MATLPSSSEENDNDLYASEYDGELDNLPEETPAPEQRTNTPFFASFLVLLALLLCGVAALAGYWFVGRPYLEAYRLAQDPTAQAKFANETATAAAVLTELSKLDETLTAAAVTPSATATITPQVLTATSSPTSVPSNTPATLPTLPLVTDTPTPGEVFAETPTSTITPGGPTLTPSNTPSQTLTPTITYTPSATITPGGPTLTPSNTPLPASVTPTLVPTLSNHTPNPNATATKTAVPRVTPTPTMPNSGFADEANLPMLLLGVLGILALLVIVRQVRTANE